MFQGTRRIRSLELTNEYRKANLILRCRAKHGVSKGWDTRRRLPTLKSALRALLRVRSLAWGEMTGYVGLRRHHHRGRRLRPLRCSTLRKLGFKVRVVETGYRRGRHLVLEPLPGARCEPSMEYSYGFSLRPELEQEWNGPRSSRRSRRRSSATSTTSPTSFDLRRDIQFKSTRVTAAHWKEETQSWETTLEDGQPPHARFLITSPSGPCRRRLCRGVEGIDSFKGQSRDTARWLHEPVELRGQARRGDRHRRHAGVRTIQEVAKTGVHPTVFQRTPNWCASIAQCVRRSPSPRRGRALDAEQLLQARIHRRFRFDERVVIGRDLRQRRAGEVVGRWCRG